MASAGAEVLVLTPVTPTGKARLEKWNQVLTKRFYYPFCKGYLSVTGRDGIWENIKSVPLRVLSLPLFLLFFYANICIAIWTFRPSTIITHWLLPTSVLTSLCIKTTSCKTFHVAHGSDVHLCQRLMIGKWILRLLASRGKLIAVSHFIANKIAAINPRANCNYIPLGVRTLTAQPRFACKQSKYRLCFLGRLVNSKGLDRLLHVMRELPGYQLAIAGDGSDRESFLRRAQELGITIDYRGPLIGKEKIDFLSSHDLFLFLPNTAKKEDFQDNLPISVMEALSCGTPVISTRVGELGHLFDMDGAGLIVNDSAKQIAKQIKSLNNEQWEQMSKEAINLTKKRTWCRCISKYHEIQ